MRNLEFSGDEPHYLLLTKSIIYDGDLDVKNQFMEKQWQEFYVLDDVKLLPHAHAVKGGWYSIHLPGVSYLLIPFYLASKPLPVYFKKFVIRLGFSLYGLLFVYILYIFLRKNFEEEISLAATAIVAFTVPAFPFFFHIFPEIPAALITLLSLYIVLYSRERFLPLAGLLSGTLIWFGVKYFIYALVLLVVAAVFRRGKSLFLLAGQLIPIIPFFTYLKVHYGTLSFLSVYYGIISPEKKAELIKLIIYKIPMELRIGTFLDYFLDQRDGLLPYAPVAIFAFAALLKFWKKKPVLLSLSFFIPFIFNYGWQTHRGGYCPPARPIASLVWVIAVGYAVFLSRTKNKNIRFLFWALFSISILLSILLASSPRAFYGPTTHEITTRAGLLFHKLSTPFFYLPNYLPSFLKHPSTPITKWAPNYFWTILVLFALVLIIKNMEITPAHDLRKISLSLIILVLLPFLALPQIPMTNGRLIMGKQGRVLVYNWKQLTGRCLKLTTGQSIVLATSYPIEIKGEGKILIQGYIEKEVSGKSILLTQNLPHLRYKGKYLLEIKLISGEEISVCP